MRHPLLVLVALVSTLAGVSCAKLSAPGSSATAPGSAPMVAAPVADDSVEAVVAQLERDWVSAIVKKDSATLERILADEFSGTSPTADVFNRRQAIADLSSARYAVASMDLDDVSVNSYGNVAVSFTSQKETSTYDGKDTSGHYHFTSVWAKKNGRWQVVASHGSRFDTSHPS